MTGHYSGSLEAGVIVVVRVWGWCLGVELGVVYVVETLVWSVGGEGQGTVCHRVGRGCFEK